MVKKKSGVAPLSQFCVPPVVPTRVSQVVPSAPPDQARLAAPPETVTIMLEPEREGVRVVRPMKVGARELRLPLSVSVEAVRRVNCWPLVGLPRMLRLRVGVPVKVAVPAEMEVEVVLSRLKVKEPPLTVRLLTVKTLATSEEEVPGWIEPLARMTFPTVPLPVRFPPPTVMLPARPVPFTTLTLPALRATLPEPVRVLRALVPLPAKVREAVGW